MKCGTQLNIPGLQRVGERACIVCGARADLFCARCAVTPYCSEPCQRKDWARRHRAVCHNLIRLQSSGAGASSPGADSVDNSNVSVPAPPAPLRQPGSVRGAAPRTGGAPSNGNRDGMGAGAKARAGGLSQTPHHPNGNQVNLNPRGQRHSLLGSPPGAPRASQGRRQDNRDDGEVEWGPTGKGRKLPEQNPGAHRAVNANNVARPALNIPRPLSDSKMRTPKSEVAAQPAVDPLPTAGTPPPQVHTPKQTSEVKAPGVSTDSAKAARVENPRSIQPTLVPSQYLVEKLPIGECFLLSVELEAAASKQKGFVCIALHELYQTQYNDLLQDICDGDEDVVPKSGDTFAYFEQSDAGWYRARCLGARAALLDAGRAVDLTALARCRALAARYRDIPEFCCVLEGNVKIGMSLKCTILMKTAEGFKVSIDDSSEDSYLGEGLVTRWLPEVETQPPKPVPGSVQPPMTPKTVQPPIQEDKPQAIPEEKPRSHQEAKPQAAPERKPVPDIPRPDIVNNERYVLLHVSSLGRASVRSCGRDATAEFESVLQDAALYGIKNAKRLVSPPGAGDVVLCDYEGVHYRALVTRTKAADNRYKVQYAEYGNEEIVPLEKLYECPPELSLSARPTRASLVALSAATHQLTSDATLYVDEIKEQVELVATIPSRDKRAPSGSLVTLSAGKDSVNKKLEDLCTPEWKKLENSGGNVLDCDVVVFSSISTLPLPTGGPFVLEVTDRSYLRRGLLCGFRRGATLPAHVYGPLAQKINEYCNSTLCKEPYLPVVEELCFAKMESGEQWCRAVVMEHQPGAPTATLLYMDYGTMAVGVPVSRLRKCMREFARDPALAATVDVEGWPKTVTEEQLSQAIQYLQREGGERGLLPVRSARMLNDMTYVVEAPELIDIVNN